MNDAIRFSRPRVAERAVMLVAAVGVSALAAFAATESAPDVDARRQLPADANAQRAPGGAEPIAPALVPDVRGELDPTMRRIDFGGAHHG